MTKRTDWILYLATALLTCGFTAFALQLWASDLTIPWTYSGDGLATAAHFKTVIEMGWYEYQPLLGAPLGQTFHDFPTADNLHMIAALVLSLFTRDYAVAFNVYFLIGFPLVSLSALWFFRYVGISGLLGAALAVVYAIAPYHFIRGEGHLFLGSYYVLPLTFTLVIMVMRGEALWGMGKNSRRIVAIFTGRGAKTTLILALTATTGSYYAVFFLIFLAFAGIVTLIRSGAWGRFWGSAIAGGVTVVGMLINMAPDILYSALNGSNGAALARGHIDSEVYALKLTQLIMPWSGHRIPQLQHVRALYDTSYPLPSEQPALGAIGAAGLIALFVLLAYFAFSRFGGIPAARALTSPLATLGHLSSLTFVAFIFSTVGGLSTIISFFTTSLRGWNRMSIVIALFCLAAVGLLLDMLIRWIVRSRNLPTTGIRIMSIATAAVLLAVGFVDQTPGNAGASYAPTKAAYLADEEWITTIESAVPEDSIILQLPYLPYPEYITVTGVLSSDALIPYLHSDTLRWSAGGIKGRPTADWPGVLQSFNGHDIATLAAASGIAGIYIDRQAIGQGWESLENQLAEQVGAAPLVSADARYSFFVLDRLRSTLVDRFSASTLSVVATDVFNPPTLATDPTFSVGLDENGQAVLTANTSRPYITSINARGESVDAVLELTLSVPSNESHVDSVTVRTPDGIDHLVPLSDGIGSLSIPVSVPPGRAQFAIQITGASESSATPISLRKASLTPATLDAFLRK